MRQSVPPKARGKEKARMRKAKDGAEKEIGREEKEIGVKAKEIG